ncbi:uncharacterized protein [Argopecten irradians]|uniref:uncharacterized protein n=1 Tax=Argopecten irradians TaxID=31199 RepID=UPI00371A3384
MSKPLSYFYDVKIDEACLTKCKGKSLKQILNSVNLIFSQKVGDQKDGKPICKTIYKFKVTGEPRMVAVVEVSGGEAMLEKITSDLVNLGITSMTCSPLIPYEVYGQAVLGVDPELCKPSPHKLSNKYISWNELTVSYQGMKWEEFKTLWAKEASTVLGLRRDQDVNVDLFKLKNCGKLMVFLSVDNPDDTDGMFAGLPLFVANGHNVSNVSRSVQPLDVYCKTP